MSHDIRTPLNAVLGMTQIAKKYKYDNDKLDNALDQISTEGNYLLTMINSILDVNQLEHGQAKLNNKPFDIGECVRNSHRKDNNICILAMTANTLAKDREDCETAGMNGFISKPINLKEISNTLKECIS